jgi:branched-chain amino acid transport system ATP-binding protein
MLEIRNLHVRYGDCAALHGISLDVPAGKIVTLIGANGAGKSTTLRTISGLVKAHSGSITFNSEDITNLPPHEVVARGLAQSPEGRMVFSNLTVLENLRMGAYLRRDKKNFPADFEFIFALFPRLRERLKQTAGTLSGGEQQMLAIGRALILVQAIFSKIVEINKTGVTILLVEQNANLALEVSDFGYVIETGKIVLHDKCAALRENAEVRAAYLGAD